MSKPGRTAKASVVIVLVEPSRAGQLMGSEVKSGGTKKAEKP